MSYTCNDTFTLIIHRILTFNNIVVKGNTFTTYMVVTVLT